MQKSFLKTMFKISVKTFKKNIHEKNQTKYTNVLRQMKIVKEGSKQSLKIKTVLNHQNSRPKHIT